MSQCQLSLYLSDKEALCSHHSLPVGMEFVPKFAINDAWILGILDGLSRQALTLEFRDSGEQWENTMGLQSALSLKPKLFLRFLQ